MSAAGQDELKEAINGLLLVLAKTRDFHDSSEVKSVLSQAYSAAFNLHKRLRNPRFVTAMVGLTNVGKSTLLNALLGVDLAPRRNGPCTSAPVEFIHGSSFEVGVDFAGSFRRRTWRCQGVEGVHRILKDLAADSGHHGVNGARRVQVTAPIGLLAQGLVIADTPGFGAAQSGEAAGSHEQALKSYLLDDVSQVFWVIRAEQGITRREMEFHDNWLSGICDDVIATGCEDWSADEQRRFSDRFGSAFKSHFSPAFYFVSGLRGWRARESGDASALQKAGITDLAERLHTAEDRVATIKGSLQQLARDIAHWTSEDGNRGGQSRQRIWEPVAWANFVGKAASNQMIAELTQYLAHPVEAHA